MSTRPVLAETSHTHRCVVCDTQIPCDSPEDPQDCLVGALTCGDCDDIPQDLPLTESGDFDPDDSFVSQDSDAANGFEDMMPGNGHRADDYDAVDFFEATLKSDDHRDEEWFPEPQTRPQSPNKPSGRSGSKSKKGRGQTLEARRIGFECPAPPSPKGLNPRNASIAPSSASHLKVNDIAQLRPDGKPADTCTVQLSILRLPATALISEKRCFRNQFSAFLSGPRASALMPSICC